MFTLSRVRDVYFFKSRRCLPFQVFCVARSNTEYFKSAENLRNYKIPLVLGIHHGNFYCQRRGQGEFSTLEFVIISWITIFLHVRPSAYDARNYLSFNHLPVWVLLSKNVLDVSTVIVAKVPSVIWAELSLRPRYLWTYEIRNKIMIVN